MYPALEEPMFSNPITDKKESISRISKNILHLDKLSTKLTLKH